MHVEACESMLGCATLCNEAPASVSVHVYSCGIMCEPGAPHVRVCGHRRRQAENLGVSLRTHNGVPASHSPLTHAPSRGGG